MSTTIINDSIRNDYAALELDSAAVWMNQSAALDDFGNCATTTGTLVRMLQDCSEHTSSDVMVFADGASLSSQCLTSELRNTSGLVSHES
ncbi:hypothetical protein PR003_g31236 [Phytophthora rubi]|uniref:Uncharacterized protein n=1 Tax=Phytophthora rubi TaxID=129364 RepID=A0A6A4B719_9STRA|nr:hypothetical protein PR003_g31236 [Phytophthora rubi]